MGKKATFAFIDKVELFLRTGTFPADATKNSKKVTRAASKRFTYKDGCLWRHYRGRLLRVVRSDEEVREILTRYHDNNNHAGQGRAIKEIMMMYYWAGVTPAVKKWIKACALCHNRTRPETQEAPVQGCLVYSCEANSFVDPELSFHKFPKDAELRQKWLLLAQRDEGSLRSNSYLCSKHFESSCFAQTEGGQLALAPDAVPTICAVAAKDDELLIPSGDDILDSTLEELLFACETNPSESVIAPPETLVELQEHQYCLTAPNPYFRAAQTPRTDQERRTGVDPSFGVYNQIARYLSHRALPMMSKKNRSSFIRRARHFSLVDGVLMYSRVSPPVRVPRDRDEVDAVLQQFHDNQGHVGQGVCQRQITKHFYWRNMTRDLSSWIASCHTCLSRTKRKWLRCSIHCCTNCCGPVERGLGLTFHKFPLHNSALLAQWVKAVGRSNWHPRIRSSVCSIHFTEDCFDRSGDKVTLYPGAVPTLHLHREAAATTSDPTDPAVGEVHTQAYFAKFDAVELYLRRRVYPPGLSYVEKNTFRRFCKNFAIKDDELHFVKRNRVSLVLRSRQQVEVVLTEYHNELNHLDVNKCLRLLNERFFWKTMRRDVMQWINSCSQCNKKKMNKPGMPKNPRGSESLLRLPQRQDDASDSGKDETSYDDDDGAGDEGSAGTPHVNSFSHTAIVIITQENPPSASSPVTSGADTINVQSSTSDSGSVSVPAQETNLPQPEVSHDTHSLSQHTQTELHHSDTCKSEGGARTRPCILVQGGTTEAAQPHPSAELLASPAQSTNVPLEPPQSQSRVQCAVKRKTAPEESPAAKRSSGLEPVVAPSTKPWPVFTISHCTQEAKSTAEAHGRAPVQQSKKGARVIVQQCSQARVKIKPALNGVDAQWAEIQTGMVAYVCFFDGATEDVAYEMANSLMTTRFFRKGARQTVSLLDLPGSVLFIPQDSLVGEPAPRSKVHYKCVCGPWWGAQLFSTLVSTCIDLMSDSAKCKTAGAKVEQGVYGQKQEIVFSSVEPQTLLLEF